MSDTPIIILVEPQLGENIGMTARAMANFGLHNMRLVNPRENWLNQKTIAAAAGAGFVIEKASLFSSVREAVADLHYLYATTARERGQGKPVHGPDRPHAAFPIRSGTAIKSVFFLVANEQVLKTKTSRSPMPFAHFPSIPNLRL